METLASVESITSCILVLRGQRVMLDAQLARLYGMDTKRLNQQVRRNLSRFPPDFMFELTPAECQEMWLQNASTLQRTSRADDLPLAFTEHGCLILTNVLRSNRAVEASVLIVRAFVRMRSALAVNAELASRLDELALEVKRQGGVLVAHDAAILKINVLPLQRQRRRNQRLQRLLELHRCTCYAGLCAVHAEDGVVAGVAIDPRRETTCSG